ncbi:MAG: hypothetical protein AAF513_02115 [Pseudomonadota bacterium]
MHRIGKRIIVLGNSCAGKSTLASALSQQTGYPWVELDALNWEAGRHGLVDHDPDLFATRMAAATSGPAWIVDGSYTAFSRRIVWPKADTLIWLDLRLPVVLYRWLTRTWQRSRSGELLWGTNRDRFLHHFKLWARDDSLLYFIVHHHHTKRRNTQAAIRDPELRHLHVIRLRDRAQVAQFLADIADIEVQAKAE